MERPISPLFHCFRAGQCRSQPRGFGDGLLLELSAKRWPVSGSRFAWHIGMPQPGVREPVTGLWPPCWSHEPVQFLCHRIRHLGGERIRRAPGCAAFGCGMAWHDARLFAGNHPDLDRRTLDEAPVFRETQPPVQLIRAAVDLKHVENQRLTFSRRPIKNGPNQPAT
jgi:hypothetical protein